MNSKFGLVMLLILSAILQSSTTSRKKNSKAIFSFNDSYLSDFKKSTSNAKETSSKLPWYLIIKPTKSPPDTFGDSLLEKSLFPQKSYRIINDITGFKALVHSFINADDPEVNTMPPTDSTTYLDSVTYIQTNKYPREYDFLIDKQHRKNTPKNIKTISVVRNLNKVLSNVTDEDQDVIGFVRTGYTGSQKALSSHIESVKTKIDTNELRKPKIKTDITTEDNSEIKYVFLGVTERVKPKKSKEQRWFKRLGKACKSIDRGNICRIKREFDFLEFVGPMSLTEPVSKKLKRLVSLKGFVDDKLTNKASHETEEEYSDESDYFEQHRKPSRKHKTHNKGDNYMDRNSNRFLEAPFNTYAKSTPNFEVLQDPHTVLDSKTRRKLLTDTLTDYNTTPEITIELMNKVDFTSENYLNEQGNRISEDNQSKAHLKSLGKDKLELDAMDISNYKNKWNIRGPKYMRMKNKERKSKGESKREKLISAKLSKLPLFNFHNDKSSLTASMSLESEESSEDSNSNYLSNTALSKINNIKEVIEKWKIENTTPFETGKEREMEEQNDLVVSPTEVYEEIDEETLNPITITQISTYQPKNDEYSDLIETTEQTLPILSSFSSETPGLIVEPEDYIDIIELTTAEMPKAIPVPTKNKRIHSLSYSTGKIHDKIGMVKKIISKLKVDFVPEKLENTILVPKTRSSKVNSAEIDEMENDIEGLEDEQSLIVNNKDEDDDKINKYLEREAHRRNLTLENRKKLQMKSQRKKSLEKIKIKTKRKNKLKSKYSKKSLKWNFTKRPWATVKPNTTLSDLTVAMSNENRIKTTQTMIQHPFMLQTDNYQASMKTEINEQDFQYPTTKFTMSRSTLQLYTPNVLARMHNNVWHHNLTTPHFEEKVINSQRRYHIPYHVPHTTILNTQLPETVDIKVISADQSVLGDKEIIEPKRSIDNTETILNKALAKAPKFSNIDSIYGSSTKSVEPDIIFITPLIDDKLEATKVDGLSTVPSQATSPSKMNQILIKSVERETDDKDHYVPIDSALKDYLSSTEINSNPDLPNHRFLRFKLTRNKPNNSSASIDNKTDTFQEDLENYISSSEETNLQFQEPEITDVKLSNTERIINGSESTTTDSYSIAGQDVELFKTTPSEFLAISAINHFLGKNTIATENTTKSIIVKEKIPSRREKKLESSLQNLIDIILDVLLNNTLTKDQLKTDKNGFNPVDEIKSRLNLLLNNVGTNSTSENGHLKKSSSKEILNATKTTLIPPKNNEKNKTIIKSAIIMEPPESYPIDEEDSMFENEPIFNERDVYEYETNKNFVENVLNEIFNIDFVKESTPKIVKESLRDNASPIHVSVVDTILSKYLTTSQNKYLRTTPMTVTKIDKNANETIQKFKKIQTLMSQSYDFAGSLTQHATPPSTKAFKIESNTLIEEVYYRNKTMYESDENYYEPILPHRPMPNTVYTNDLEQESENIKHSYSTESSNGRLFISGPKLIEKYPTSTIVYSTPLNDNVTTDQHSKSKYEKWTVEDYDYPHNPGVSFGFRSHIGPDSDTTKSVGRITYIAKDNLTHEEFESKVNAPPSAREGDELSKINISDKARLEQIIHSNEALLGNNKLLDDFDFTTVSTTTTEAITRLDEFLSVFTAKPIFGPLFKSFTYEYNVTEDRSTASLKDNKSIHLIRASTIQPVWDRKPILPFSKNVSNMRSNSEIWSMSNNSTTESIKNCVNCTHFTTQHSDVSSKSSQKNQSIMASDLFDGIYSALVYTASPLRESPYKSDKDVLEKKPNIHAESLKSDDEFERSEPDLPESISTSDGLLEEDPDYLQSSNENPISHLYVLTRKGMTLNQKYISSTTIASILNPKYTTPTTTSVPTSKSIFSPAFPSTYIANIAGVVSNNTTANVIVNQSMTDDSSYGMMRKIPKNEFRKIKYRLRKPKPYASLLRALRLRQDYYEDYDGEDYEEYDRNFLRKTTESDVVYNLLNEDYVFPNKNKTTVTKLSSHTNRKNVENSNEIANDIALKSTVLTPCKHCAASNLPTKEITTTKVIETTSNATSTVDLYNKLLQFLTRDILSNISLSYTRIPKQSIDDDNFKYNITDMPNSKGVSLNIRKYMDKNNSDKKMNNLEDQSEASYSDDIFWNVIYDTDDTKKLMNKIGTAHTKDGIYANVTSDKIIANGVRDSDIIYNDLKDISMRRIGTIHTTDITDANTTNNKQAATKMNKIEDGTSQDNFENLIYDTDNLKKAMNRIGITITDATNDQNNLNASNEVDNSRLNVTFPKKKAYRLFFNKTFINESVIDVTYINKTLFSNASIEDIGILFGNVIEPQIRHKENTTGFTERSAADKSNVSTEAFVNFINQLLTSYNEKTEGMRKKIHNNETSYNETHRKYFNNLYDEIPSKRTSLPGHTVEESKEEDPNKKSYTKQSIPMEYSVEELKKGDSNQKTSAQPTIASEYVIEDKKKEDSNKINTKQTIPLAYILEELEKMNENKKTTAQSTITPEYVAGESKKAESNQIATQPHQYYAVETKIPEANQKSYAEQTIPLEYVLRELEKANKKQNTSAQTTIPLKYIVQQLKKAGSNQKTSAQPTIPLEYVLKELERENTKQKTLAKQIISPEYAIEETKIPKPNRKTYAKQNIPIEYVLRELEKVNKNLKSSPKQTTPLEYIVEQLKKADPNQDNYAKQTISPEYAIEETKKVDEYQKTTAQSTIPLEYVLEQTKIADPNQEIFPKPTMPMNYYVTKTKNKSLATHAQSNDITNKIETTHPHFQTTNYINKQESSTITSTAILQENHVKTTAMLRKFLQETRNITQKTQPNETKEKIHWFQQIKMFPNKLREDKIETAIVKNESTKLPATIAQKSYFPGYPVNVIEHTSPMTPARNTTDKITYPQFYEELEPAIIQNRQQFALTTCGIDNSDSKVVRSGPARIETYPWLGVLIYPKGNHRFLTRVILVATHLVIGAALDIDKLPKKDFRDLAKVVLGHNCTGPRIDVINYNYHPEFRNGYANTIALIQIDSQAYRYKLRPICAPPKQVFLDAQFYATVQSDDCKSSFINVYDMDFVSLKICKDYYLKPGLNSLVWPRHAACARTRHGGKCVWRSGSSVLVVKQGNRWHLLGLGSSGLGCTLPSRYVDYTKYAGWVTAAISRIGLPAVTRLAPNRLVLRRSTDQIQRFGPCDSGEIAVEIFADTTDVLPTYGTEDKGALVTYDLTVLHNVDYQCVVFYAYNVGATGRTQPRLELRPSCRYPPAFCMRISSYLPVHFYVTIYFYQPIKYKVLAYGKERKKRNIQSSLTRSSQSTTSTAATKTAKPFPRVLKIRKSLQKFKKPFFKHGFKKADVNDVLPEEQLERKTVLSQPPKHIPASEALRKKLKELKAKKSHKNHYINV